MAKVIKETEENVEEVEVPTSEEETEESGPTNAEEEWDTRKMDPDEELWAGGPTIAMLNKWKDKYGKVYATEFLGDFYIWRTLTRQEYKMLAKNLETAIANGDSQHMASLENEDAVAELCIIYPKYDRNTASGSMAGVATSIASQVMEASGFTPTDIREL